jgi:hypothetical protein
MSDYQRREKTTSHLGKVLCITAFLCLLLFALVGCKSSQETGEEPNLSSGVEFEDDQVYHPSATLSGSITIPGFDTWTIDAGETTVSSKFYNPQANTCYFVIRVTVEDTGETIYESKYIKPGQSLYQVELLRPMEAGSYQATIHYSTYSMADGTPMNGADVPFRLVVQ